MNDVNKILKEFEGKITECCQSITLEYKPFKGYWEKGDWEVVYYTGPHSWYSIRDTTPLKVMRRLKKALQPEQEDGR